MKKILDYIKKHKRGVIITAIIVAIAPVILVHVFFKIQAPCDLLSAEWSAGSILDYIATLFSAFATICLSIFALESSEKANELSQKVTEIEQDRYHLELRPFVLLTDWFVSEVDKESLHKPSKKYIRIDGSGDSGLIGISLRFTNTTNSWVSAQYISGTINGETHGYSTVNQQNIKLQLGPGQSDEYVFCASEKTMKYLNGKHILIDIVLENRFSKRYNESFDLFIISISKIGRRVENNWFCSVQAQNYTLKKIEYDKEGNLNYEEEEL